MLKAVMATQKTSTELRTQWVSPMLPLPVLKYETIQHRAMLETQDLVPLYRGNLFDAGDRDLIINSQPVWRKKWLQQNSQELIHLVNAPKELQSDYTFCPIHRIKTYEQHKVVLKVNPTWLNYPILSPPARGERISEHYMVKTLRGAIARF